MKHGQHLRANLRYLRRTAPVCCLIATEGIKRPVEGGADGEGHTADSDSDSDSSSTTATSVASTNESDQLMLGELQTVHKQLFAQAEIESRALSAPNATISNNGEVIPDAVGASEAGEAATAAVGITMKQENPTGSNLEEDSSKKYSAAETAARASAKRTAYRRDSQGRYITEREILLGTQEEKAALEKENRAFDGAPGAHHGEGLQTDATLQDTHEEMQRAIGTDAPSRRKLTNSRATDEACSCTAEKSTPEA